MTEGSNAAAMRAAIRTPDSRMRGNRAYMDIKDNGYIKDTIGNHKDIIRFHEDTTPAYG